ncbi:MAG: hypothetical protein A2W99_16620 [Bacteroidetes bacterium GWF2_33_16]|nr:MAG: hypothetical protein A2X00_14175 [Bacteroidetes bacterium GWE2_32_14]OFY03374.1 MAG: hypothetical protein A2W99_16620 [Bacteroidetes bacterium GWF2_33_16]
MFAQNSSDEIVIAKKVKLFSNVLNEERTLFIKLPDDYATSNKHYPVVFQLDGAERSCIKRLADVYRLQDEGLMPEVVNISIVNTDRNRDVFPFKTLYHRTSGGADNFIRFISEELIPFIDSSYRTTRHRTLVGFSGSGILVLYYLVSKPEDFEAYVPCSPSIAFDTDFFIDKLNSLFEKHVILKKTVAIVFGSAEGQAYYGEQYYFDMTNAVTSITNAFKENAPKGFNWSITSIPGGIHVPEGGVYEGLKNVFLGWKPLCEPEIMPAGGFFDFISSLPVSINSTSKEVFYTIDGSEPTRNSLKYTNPIKVSSPCNLKVKAIDGEFGESEISEVVFKQAPSFTGERFKGKTQKGISYQYYENYYFREGLPDFNEEAIVETGTTDQINLGIKKQYEGFAISFEGLIKIEKDGSYTFSVRSNDESKVILDGYDLIFKERGYPYDEKSGIVTLAKGFHSFKVLYVGPAFKKKLDLAVYYEGLGVEKQEIPAEVLFHKIGN